MLEYLIDAMTFQRGKAEDRITDLGRPLLKHVIKLYLYPKSQYVIGWEREVRAWYLDISNVATSLKGGKKFKPHQVTGFLYTDYYTRPSKLQDRVESIVELNDELLPIDFDIDDMHRSLIEIYLTIGECSTTEVPWAQLITKLKYKLIS